MRSIQLSVVFLKVVLVVISNGLNAVENYLIIANSDLEGEESLEQFIDWKLELIR